MFWKFKPTEIDSAVEKVRQWVDEREARFFTIEVKKHREQRSLSQNKYWWIICMLIGTKLGIAKEAVHKLLNLENNGEIIHLGNGKVKLVPGETHTMDTAQFAALIQKARVWAQQEIDMYIMTPEEFKEHDYHRIKSEYETMFY